MGMLTHTENVDLRYWKMLTNFTEMVDGFPEKVDSCRCQISNFHMMHCAGYKTIKKEPRQAWVTLAVAVERMWDFCAI